MGWQQTMFPLLIINAAASGFTGLFVYSPTPGAGNLKAGMAAADGTDPYGNRFGHNVFATDGTILIELRDKNLMWDNPADSPFALPLVVGSPSAANGNSLQISTAEGVVSGSPAALTLYDSAASSAVAAIPSGSPGIFLASGCYLYADQWHSLGSPGITNLTTDAGRYRFTPQGDVEIDVNCHATAAIATTTGTFAQALPAAYRPAFDRTYPLGQPIASDASGRISVASATGVVSLHIPALNNGNIVGNTITMPTT